MNLKHLRYFAVLAEELHIGRAAEKLNIDQSPLSRTIKKLESDLGVLLFVRDKQRITSLTPAGEKLQKSIPLIFNQLKAIKHNVISASNTTKNTIRIGINGIINVHKFSQLLHVLKKNRSEMDIQMKEVNYTELVDGLNYHYFDLGFCYLADNTPNLTVNPAWESELSLLASASHPLFWSNQVTLQDVCKYPIVAPHPEYFPGYYAQLMALYNLHNLQPEFIEYSKSFEHALTLVSAGYGVTLAMQSNSLCLSRVIAKKITPSVNIKSYVMYQYESPLTELINTTLSSITAAPTVDNALVELINYPS